MHVFSHKAGSHVRGCGAKDGQNHGHLVIGTNASHHVGCKALVDVVEDRNFGSDIQSLFRRQVELDLEVGGTGRNLNNRRQKRIVQPWPRLNLALADLTERALDAHVSLANHGAGAQNDSCNR